MCVSHVKYAVVPTLAILLLTSCGGSTTLPTPIVGQQSQHRTVQHNSSSCPCLYVADEDAAVNSVTVYASGATGNATPIQNIQGSYTGLSQPYDVAVDGNNDIYVANATGGGTSDNSGSITIYAAGATGNATPIATIAGSSTGLHRPEGIALDPVNGDIYVANASGGSSSTGSITIYSSTANGNVAPIGVIAGSSTGLSSPAGLTLDASGNIYVPNAATSTITVYAAGSSGNVAPTRTIAGSHTKMGAPYQLALDSSLNIYVANASSKNSKGLTVYAAGANGNVAPLDTIKGGSTKLDYPDGIALDSSGNIYAASEDCKSSSTCSITEYAAGSNGNVAPTNTIEGAATGLKQPAGIAIGGSGAGPNVFVADTYNSAVKEILAAGGYTTINTLGSGFNDPYGVAVDASGNVYVADTFNSAVKEILAAGGYTTVNTLGSGFHFPRGVAVDASDNVYVADTNDNTVKEILAAGGYTTINTLGSGFLIPYGVAVDASDNVFVADSGNNAVKEILAAGGYTTINTLGSGFDNPDGVAVDASGNVYVADSGHSTVKEILAVGDYTTINTLGSGFDNPGSVAVYNPLVQGPARRDHRRPRQ